jgi:hypothetical protein
MFLREVFFIASRYYNSAVLCPSVRPSAPPSITWYLLVGYVVVLYAWVMEPGARGLCVNFKYTTIDLVKIIINIRTRIGLITHM